MSNQPTDFEATLDFVMSVHDGSNPATHKADKATILEAHNRSLIEARIDEAEQFKSISCAACYTDAVDRIAQLNQSKERDNE